MIKIIVLVAFMVSVTLADLPVTPPAPPASPPPVLCGETPVGIYRCLGRPQLLNSEAAAECAKSSFQTPCDQYTCIFNKAGWMDAGGKVDSAKVTAHLDLFAKGQPAWAPAVDHVKNACLTTELPAQGGYLSCPAYDVWLCVLSGIIKNAADSQWSTEGSCQYPRQFAASCPVCPGECFAPAVRVGACNACAVLPRSP